MGRPHPASAAMEVTIAGNQLETLRYVIQAEVALGARGAPQPEARTLGETPAPAYVAGAEPAAGSAWSAAVRALRERTRDEVEAQLARITASTGREWQVTTLDFGRPMRLGGGARSRLVLLTRVLLRAREPTLH